MQISNFVHRYIRHVLRIAFSHYVANGLSAALGLLLITGVIHFLLNPVAAAAAAVGVIVCIPPDQPARKRGKFWQLLPAAVIGLPLFFAVQILHPSPLYLGLLLVPATFLAFLGAAWGKRGLPISISIMFAMIFSMAAPYTDSNSTALASSLYFALGAGLYLIYATLANALLNSAYRRQIVADTLFSLATLLRVQAQQFNPITLAQQNLQDPLLAKILHEQATLADQLQAARDIVLEAPRTPARQQLAGMLLQMLELRDHLLVCELDIDTLKAHPAQAPLLEKLRKEMDAIADAIDALADALLLKRTPAMIDDRRAKLSALRWEQNHEATPGGVPLSLLGRSLSGRIAFINDETIKLYQLARGDIAPDVAAVRTAWQMFVSTTRWSWRPLVTQWAWDAPPFRHAIRASLAIGTAYSLSLLMPWGTHDYWILITIVVVLRGSLAQTLERRNSRVIGTVAGCILAGLVLSAHPTPVVSLILVTIAQAIAHAFGTKRYLITAISATLLGLLQAHMLHTSGNPVFYALERIADTLIGVIIAWPFSYLLPSWERTQIPALVKRTLDAQARHTRIALSLGQLHGENAAPEMEWRLARREAYDSLSALVQATQRSLVEPRAVRPPLESLEYLLAHSYQLLAQLTAAKTLLLLRRERLDAQRVRVPLLHTAEYVENILSGKQHAAIEKKPVENPSELVDIFSDPFEHDLSPWLIRRLILARELADQLRIDADIILAKLPMR